VSHARRSEGGRLRGEILAAALELIDEAGTDQAVTLRAVARRAGIAAPSIYRHFADRQAILLTLVHDAFKQLRDRLADAQPAGGADSPTRLRAACHAYLDFSTDHPQLYRVMLGGLWGAANELGQDPLLLLTEAVTDCVRDGQLTSSSPTADAIALWIGLHGLAHQRAVTPDFPWPEDITDRLINPLTQTVGSAGW
jgi:AcrR family transcriptional regulator